MKLMYVFNKCSGACVLLIALLCSPGALAIGGDSLVRFSDLTFKSDVERANFLNLARHSPKNVIELMLATYDRAETYDARLASRRIEECVADLENETRGLTVARRVKQVYKQVHRRFLKTYNLNNSFADIFEKGEYNCVSASALYAIIFRQMSIPFQIVESPQHVYLVAYPQAERILIETTSPEHGYLRVTESDMAKYTRYLYNAKLITREEYEGKSQDELFDKYYYSGAGIELDNMPAIQYFNYAVYHLQDKNYDKAAEEIKKACFIDPSDRNKYLLESVLAYLVTSNGYSDTKQVDNLVILCSINNLSARDLNNAFIHNEFRRVLDDQLRSQSDYARFDSSFARIHGAVKDTGLKNDIAFDYHYELGRLGMIALRDRAYEMKHLEAAYRINPKHADLQNIILTYFAKLCEKSSEPQPVLKTMAYFDSSFDFLKDNVQYNVIKADCFLELAYQNVTLGDIKKAEGYLADFETVCSAHKDLKADERFIEKAYSQIASYYYKKGNIVKTRQTLNTGIKYAPESFGLRMRLSQAR